MIELNEKIEIEKDSQVVELDFDLEEYKKNPKTSYLAQEYEGILHQENQTKTMMETDVSLRELAQEEMVEFKEKKKILQKQIEDIIEQTKEEEKFPNEIILEIRAGAGGDEASLFAQNLAEMYEKFSEKEGWRFKLLGSSTNATGGYKEASFEIKGQMITKNYVLKQECIEFKEFL